MVGMCEGKTIKKTEYIEHESYEKYIITFTDDSKLEIKSIGYFGEESGLEVEEL